MRARSLAVCRRVLAVALVSSVVASCGLRAQADPERLADDDVPFGLLDVTTTSTPSGVDGSTVCLVDDDRLVQVVRTPLGVEPAVSDEPLLSIVRGSLGGVSPLEESQGLSTTLEPDAIDEVVEGDSGVVTVSFAEGAFSSIGRDRQVLAVAQLTCTLTSRPGIDQVRFTRDGRTLEVPREDGSLSSDPVSRSDYPTLVPG